MYATAAATAALGEEAATNKERGRGMGRAGACGWGRASLVWCEKKQHQLSVGTSRWLLINGTDGQRLAGGCWLGPVSNYSIIFVLRCVSREKKGKKKEVTAMMTKMTANDGWEVAGVDTNNPNSKTDEH